MGFLMLASSIPFLLGLVMLTMGMTLGARDFLPLLKRPWDVCLGVAAHLASSLSGRVPAERPRT